MKTNTVSLRHIQRNELLRKTDIYMLPDVYETLTEKQQQEVRVFRKSLRDIMFYLERGMTFVEFPKTPEWLSHI